jgi:hypothetical protein
MWYGNGASGVFTNHVPTMGRDSRQPAKQRNTITAHWALISFRILHEDIPAHGHELVFQS